MATAAGAGELALSPRRPMVTETTYQAPENQEFFQEVDSRTAKSPIATALLVLPSGREIHVAVIENEIWHKIEKTYANAKNAKDTDPEAKNGYDIGCIVTLPDIPSAYYLKVVEHTNSLAGFTFISYAHLLHPDKIDNIRNFSTTLTMFYNTAKTKNIFIYGTAFSTKFLMLCLYIHENYQVVDLSRKKDFTTVKELEKAVKIIGGDKLHLGEKEAKRLQGVLNGYFHYMKGKSAPSEKPAPIELKWWQKCCCCCKTGGYTRGGYKEIPSPGDRSPRGEFGTMNSHSTTVTYGTEESKTA